MAPKEKKQGSGNKAGDAEWSLEEKPVKVDKWDGVAVKNALDDQAKKYLLEKHEYVESHRLMDGRLLVCTIAVGFAMFALVWDYLHPFPESRPVLITCVCSYFIMMGVLTLYTTFKEKGCFLLALEKDKAGIDPDDIWTLTSTLKRYDDLYTLQLEYQSGTSDAKDLANFSKSVASFYDENGYICADILEKEVAALHLQISKNTKKGQ